MEKIRSVLSFEGRISRLPFWIASIVLLVLYAGLLAGLFAAMGLPADAIAEADPQVALARLFTSLALGYPTLAVAVQRLHDRNRSGWWAALLFGMAVLVDLSDLAGLSGTTEEPSLLLFALGIPLLAASIWFIVEAALLPGTRGPNRFGPDPLGRAADASL